MKKQLPKIVYVAWEDDENPYLSAEENLDGLAMRDGRVVGVYQLVELQEIQLVVKTTVKTKKVNYKD